MSYSKHTWIYNEVISSEGLNHMEQGIEDAIPAPEGPASGQVLTWNGSVWVATDTVQFITSSEISEVLTG